VGGEKGREKKGGTGRLQGFTVAGVLADCLQDLQWCSHSQHSMEAGQVNGRRLPLSDLIQQQIISKIFSEARVSLHNAQLNNNLRRH
jgi:hypothetical protein